MLVDWSQNDEHKTTICVYSLRARERPTVSTPVTWDEVEAAATAGDAELPGLHDRRRAAPRRAEGDLFAAALSVTQKLPALDAAR